MIRITLADIPAADRLVEALYVAAGHRPGTAQAREWLELAHHTEQGIDAVRPVRAAVTEGAAA